MQWQTYIKFTFPGVSVSLFAANFSVMFVSTKKFNIASGAVA